MLGYLIKQLFFDIILIFLILYVEFIPLLSCKEVLINTIKELLLRFINFYNYIKIY